MKKKILLIGYNFYPEPTGIGKYSGEMIQWLAKNGYDCTVITTYPYYPYWKVQEPYDKDKYWYKTEEERFSSGGRITVHRCPMYVPAKPTGIKRVILDFSFLVSAAFKLLLLLPSRKFDSVFVVAPSFQFGLLGILYKKLRGTHLTYHIQDMQIEAARDLQLIKSDKLINSLFAIERYIFRQADSISTISPGMIRKVAAKASKPVVSFPNWADISLFYPLDNRAELKKEFGFAETDKIILYSGAIGEKQGLEAILYAAKEFIARREVKFIICGSGPYKANLQALAQSLELENIHFLPLQPFERFNQFLNIADVHLVIQKSHASDLVMPSKLTTILAVGGLALITADADTSLHSLVTEYDMGLLVNAESQEALNEGIRKAITGDNSKKIKNARTYAENHLSIEGIMANFVISTNL